MASTQPLNSDSLPSMTSTISISESEQSSTSSESSSCKTKKKKHSRPGKPSVNTKLHTIVDQAILSVLADGRYHREEKIGYEVQKHTFSDEIIRWRDRHFYGAKEPPTPHPDRNRYWNAMKTLIHHRAAHLRRKGLLKMRAKDRNVRYGSDRIYRLTTKEEREDFAINGLGPSNGYEDVP